MRAWAVVVQVHPPHPFHCSQHRRAAEPYKFGRAARLAATAGRDTQDYNHFGHGPREFGDHATNVDRAGSTPAMVANSNTPAEGTAALALRRLAALVRVQLGVPSSPLKHIEMCSALVMRRQLVQIQPSAPVVPLKL